MRLSEAATGRDNNFNLIRFLAAIAVLISHAYPIALGRHTPQPLASWLEKPLGHLAVLTFFAISGLLITQSWSNTPKVRRWVTARALRIFPGLLVCLLLTLLCFGPLTTELSLAAYWDDPQTWSYLPRNLSLYLLQFQLPGVFADNPLPQTINGSIWTLKYELTLYVAVAVLGLLGGIARPRIGLWFVAGAIVLTAAVLWVHSSVGMEPQLVWFAQMALPFTMGSALFLLRQRIILSIWILAVMIALTALARNTPGYHVALSAVIVYGTMYLAYVPGGVLRGFNQLGDYSYGVYIYAFPIQQLGAHLLPGQSPVQNIMFALPLTLGCAVVSWHCVEKPALALKRRARQRAAPN